MDRHATDTANTPAAVMQTSECLVSILYKCTVLHIEKWRTLDPGLRLPLLSVYSRFTNTGAEVLGVATLGPLLNIKCQFAQSGQRGAGTGSLLVSNG